MDLREKKTKRSIKNAFIHLRSQKPLEKISVKELTESAEISKATFYLHYRDIYDLSQILQAEVIQNILDSLQHPDVFLSNEPLFTKELFHAFLSQQPLIDILFSGAQASVLPISIEEGLRKHIFELIPEAQNDAALHILLTYKIQGCYYAYQKHHNRYPADFILDTIYKKQQIPCSSLYNLSYK